MADVLIVDVESGEKETRPLTPAEQSQRAADDAAAAAKEEADAAAATEQDDASTRLAAVRAKALQVRDGSATFTAAEVQRILAAIVLRATR